MDMKIDFNGTAFDTSFDGYDLASERGLRTAVIISLFTDRRAEPDDVIPDGTTDRRGHWGDAYLDNDNDSIGSRLWLLAREKQTQDVLNRAREYCIEALQWLIDDNIASAVNVTTEWLRRGVMAIYVIVLQGDNQLYQDIFNYELEAA